MSLGLRIGSLFSGIGGLERGLEDAGLGHVVWQVEKDPYCRAVLAKHWPDVERYEDVCEFHPPGPVDVLCGGFPCQPWSLAGKRREHVDERHLWPEFARIIGEASPAIVVGENVPGLRARGLRLVLADLAGHGFDAEWSLLAAADVGAPHLRRRLFVVATHPERIQLRDQPGWLGRACREAAAVVADHGGPGCMADADGATGRPEAGDADCGPGGEALCGGSQESGRRGEAMADSDGEGELQQGGSEPQFGRRTSRVRRPNWGGWPAEPDVGRVAHGIPSRVDRLRALGNAVVPQVAEVIGRAIARSAQARRVA